MWKQRINRALGSVGYEIRRRPAPGPASGPKGGPKPGAKAAPKAAPKAGPKVAPKTSGPAKSAPSARTVAEGWDHYGRVHRGQSNVGDEWNAPALIGLDVERPEDVVPYLDREVFTPFLGTCEVIVEIGSGAGRLTEVLLPKCDRLIAVDTSPAMIELLKERFADEPKMHYRLSDGRGLPEVADLSVDAVFSYGVFVHLQHWDIYNYLTEVQRVLKPGGKALIQHSSTFSPLGWQAFVREVPRQLNKHKRPASFIVNTPELMREFVSRAGLECVDTLTDVVRRDCITLIRKPE